MKHLSLRTKATNTLNLKWWETFLLTGLTLAVLLYPETAGATTRTVTSLNDDGGAGTLRKLIAASTADDTINFAITGTITLTSELGIGRNLTITGPGAASLTVSGNNASRVFNVVTNVSSPNTTVNLSSLTISSGKSDEYGGGIYNNGGILKLNNCTLTGNSANDGGGIYNDGGILTVNNCTISGNTAEIGGGIWNEGTLTVNNCTLTGNSANDGGGIEIYQGTATINNCTFSGNYASFSGGGIESNSNLTANNCTLYGNSSDTYGGGISCFGILTANNCTLYGNSSDTYGGGITCFGTLAANNCTISGNSAHDEGGGIQNEGTIFILNTIVANNTIMGGVGPDVEGPVSSQGHNFVGQTDGSSGWVGSDLLGTLLTPRDPLLGPLQDNGGATWTMALLPTSPAIDAGDDAILNAPFNLSTDQRGVPRKIGPYVDIGAFEYDDPPQPGPNYVVTTLDDHYDGVTGVGDCTLSEAVIAANTFGGPHTITFAPGLQGTLRLTQGVELGINSSTTIVGPADRSITISGDHTSRVFNIFHASSAHTVTIANLNITDGQSGTYGGGIYVDSQQTLNLDNCTIYGNVSVGSGGGLANNGLVFATNCTFSGNQAHEGGGIYTYAGAVLLRNCTVCSNVATVNGGGLYNFNIVGSVFTLGGTLLANNTAGSSDPDAVSDPGDPFISLGYNLIGNGDLGYGFANGVNHDLVGSSATPLNPLLGPLANNGGPTLTHALLAGSPAIDAGDDSITCCLTTDQHGFLRRIGAHVDIGAFEYELTQSGPNYIVTTTDDHNDGTAGVGDCTLREAVLAADANAGPSTITFAPGVTGAITLTDGELVISNNLTMTGPTLADVRISGNNLSRVFHVTGGTVSLSNLTLRDGFAEGYSGGLLAPGGDGNGGGILNEATLTLTACTLTGNTALGGPGGISISSGVPAGSGGNGNGGGLFNQGTLHLINCTLSGNSAGGGGGGLNVDFSARGGDGGYGNGGAIFNQGTLTVTHCTFSRNSATSSPAGSGNPLGNDGLGLGGGLYHSQGSIAISSSIIAGNTAASIGPDVVGALTSSGYNLIGTISGSSGVVNGVNQDQAGTSESPIDALIGPLADNGGPTFTHALLSGSPAIDRGISFGLATDQRGRQRPYDFSSLPDASGGDGSDIGAFELNPGLLTPPLLNIARSANNVVLSWSTSDTGFTLEAKANLNPAIPWITVPGTPVIVESQYVVTNGSATGNMFYRFRNP